eukprot:CAMPEP_0198362248 /NCGR_PEP_ID=MMETSP1450-20131203/145342_1 /TAXON_ID=753684 ORGANISM="Madagascaria erythrocladiodes, Strain CCMP3234" /NCGR_SAMPLE_ID=MMETSP1450 /ASSEMBLY_ACC=CAM_ASM_001115 /LENGTH=86 /DNA_ID=CAMNT_0044069445 /DNA_START=33 /DNA_END=289 /DNA_ORIENTATION=-
MATSPKKQDKRRTCERCGKHGVAARVSAFSLSSQWWCRACVEAKLADEAVCADEHYDGYAHRVARDVWSVFVPSHARRGGSGGGGG